MAPWEKTFPNEEPERMEDAAVYPDALQKCNQWYR
jgi:hypothetical protein